MSAFESMVVIKHARHLKSKYGNLRAAKYLCLNGVDISIALALCANKYGNVSNEFLAANI